MNKLKKWAVENPEDSEDIYKEQVVEILTDDDELSYEEAAFMSGYNQL